MRRNVSSFSFQQQLAAALSSLSVEDDDGEPALVTYHVSAEQDEVVRQAPRRLQDADAAQYSVTNIGIRNVVTSREQMWVM